MDKSAGKQIMVYLNGSKTSFRCDVSDGRGPCNGNVFTVVRSGEVRCNSCRTLWSTEIPSPWDRNETKERS